MKIEYIKQGDYLIPNLKVNEQKNINIGKYGLLRLNYLKQHNKSLYTTLLMQDKLTDYLISVDKECNDKFNLLIEQYKENDIRLSENNKQINQMEWIKLMNNYKNSVEEIILKENIYI